jgi:hypothetical protein
MQDAGRKTPEKAISEEFLRRLQSEAFVQHSVHDVQLPIPGRNRPQGFAPNLPAKDWSNVLYFKGAEYY